MPRDEGLIAVVVGVRPEIIKMAPVVHALRARAIPHEVIYANQHVRPEMCDVFFETLGYRPDWRLPLGGPWPLFTPGRALHLLTQRLQQLRDAGCHALICQGDTSTTCSAALAAVHAGLRVVHLEAGLRSRDMRMLEERHRRAVDHMADELLTYTPEQGAVLSAEQVPGRITQVGNPMVDVITGLWPIIREWTWSRSFVYVTMHRKEFTDDPARMRAVFEAIARAAAAKRLEVVCPVHPRTLDCLARAGVTLPFAPMAPLDVVESLARIHHAVVVVTDSGGVQEEAALLGTRCVTVRENTERPETVEVGANRLAGFDPEMIELFIAIAADTGRVDVGELYGRPGVGDRVVDVLVKEA